MKLSVFSLLLACPLLASAADLPELTLPAGVGVNIHFVTGHEQDLDKIAAAGFKFIRMDFSWSGTEPEKGVYRWSAYDTLSRNLAQRGLRAIYILDYSNPLYEETVTSRNPLNGREQRDTASPQHPESIEAFARWAAEAAQHFKDNRVIWEIWNEPNISFWKPKPNVDQYKTLALATAKAVRAADPNATILGPASSEFPWPFLESFLTSGILEYLDGVSVHPYRNYQKSPETAGADYARLRGLIKRYAPTPEKKLLPIISGEWGYASHTKGVSLDTQAAFIARQQLANLLYGVPISIWYDWKNDGTDANEREHNFGAVLPDLTPKPAYNAVRTLTQQLAGHRIVRRLVTPNDTDYVLLLQKGDGPQKLAAWTVGEAHLAQVDLGGISVSSLAAVDWKGDSLSVKQAGSQLELELTDHPAFIGLTR